VAVRREPITSGGTSGTQGMSRISQEPNLSALEATITTKLFAQNLSQDQQLDLEITFTKRKFNDAAAIILKNRHFQSG
jgi:hypothetical protein